MKFTVYDPEDGKLRARIDQSAPIAPPGFRVIDGWHDGATAYVAHSKIAPRPLTGLPETQALSVGEAWIIDPLPDATLVVIDGEAAGSIDSGEAIEFELAGVYAVELRPPFPWIGGACAVTVT